MKNKIKLISFFTAFLFAFGITSLDFDNLSFEDNQRGYIAIALGLVMGIVYFVLRKREKQNS